MDPVNLAYFREAAMDDEEFMRELADLFRSDTPKQLDRIREAVTGGDFAEAAAAAHRLKGSSGNVGAQSLFALARQLEIASQSQRTTTASHLADQVEVECGRVCDFLEAAFSTDGQDRSA
jgi:HPt (histidine-containing phosphotransfer) domain-containing protein